MINNKFKAVFNPFNRNLTVLYGDCLTEYVFEELDEWTKISFNGDRDHPNYLHVHLHYDEGLQLIFYPREDGDRELHEDQCVTFNSIYMNVIHDNLKIVYNDPEYIYQCNLLK